MSTNNCKQKYYVTGMHCNACEILIKNEIKDIKGVQNVDVSLSKQELVITSNDQKTIPNLKHLNSIFDEMGYTFSLEKKKVKSLSGEDALKIFGVLLLFIFVFLTLEKTGLLMSISLTSESSYISYFAFGIAAGVSSCAALVGGLLLSMSQRWNTLYNNNSKKSALPFVYFNISRILSFTILGGFLGLIGNLIKVSFTFTSVLTIFVSIIMIILGFQMLGINFFKRFSFNFFKNISYFDKNKEIEGKFFPVILGALTFFIPCGFTLIAQTNALNSSSFYEGALKLLFFALGTLPILAIISFSSVRFYNNPEFTNKFNFFAGVLIVFFAFYSINSQLNVLGAKSLNDISNFSKVRGDVSPVTTEGDYQVINLQASGFRYTPGQITIKSGEKTKLKVNNLGATGCANAMYARGLYEELIVLKKGQNVVEFVAPKPGVYKISCSMGMVDPVIVTVL